MAHDIVEHWPIGGSGPVRSKGAATLEVPMTDLTRKLTLNLKVTGVKRAQLRSCIGRKLLFLAARVMGCNVDVEVRS